ncbi:MAG: hypothetical protein R3F07_09380 [Opitutaceae bacterium]
MCDTRDPVGAATAAPAHGGDGPALFPSPIMGIPIAFILVRRYPLAHGRMVEIRGQPEGIRGKV